MSKIRYDSQTGVYDNELSDSLPPLQATSIFERLLGKVSFDDQHIVFVEEFGKKRSLTLGQLKLKAQQLGGGLQKAGLKSGDAVMLLLPNNVDFVVALMAAQFAGLRVALANPGYQANELKHVHHLTQPKKIFVPTKLMRSISKAGIPWHTVITTDARIGRGGTMFVDDVMLKPDEARVLQPQKIDDPNETAYLPFSSGTTGLPKAVEISHTNICAMLSMLLHLPGAVREGDRFVGFLPFFHAMALLLSVHMPIASRCTVFITAGFEPVAYAKLLKREQISSMSVVPPVLNALANHPKITKEHFASLRYVSCGAAPTDADLQAKFIKKSGITDVRQGWGMTETTVSALGFTPDCALGTVGYVLPGAQARVVDLETGKDVAQGERGELWVRGLNITKGYYRNPEATKGTFSSDGKWLRTGDIAVVNENGEFAIVDRAKELIKYNGWQVSPAELEGLLLAHPKVAQAAVIGVYSQEQSTELPRAYVKLQPNSSVTPEELIAYVKERTSPQKQLRGGVRIIDSVPISASGKVLRRQLRALVEQEERAAKEAAPQARL